MNVGMVLVTMSLEKEEFFLIIERIVCKTNKVYTSIIYYMCNFKIASLSNLIRLKPIKWS